MGPEAMLAFKIIGGVVSAVGSMRQAQAAKDAANFNAAVNRNNAIASRQAADAQQQKHDRQSRLRAGANRTCGDGDSATACTRVECRASEIDSEIRTILKVDVLDRPRRITRAR